MKINFEVQTEFGVFRDALHLDSDHTYTDKEIDSMKTQRANDWVNFVKNPGPGGEPTKFFVGFAPSNMEIVKKLFDFVGISRADTFYDLGCGDGGVLIEAAKRGAKCIGIELNEEMIGFTQDNARLAGVDVTVIYQDVRDADLSNATCVFLYLGSDANQDLSDKLRSMKPGTKVITFCFEMLGFKQIFKTGADLSQGFVYEVE